MQKSIKKKIFFEFGCEDHGILTNLKNLKKILTFSKIIQIDNILFVKLVH